MKIIGSLLILKTFLLFNAVEFYPAFAKKVSLSTLCHKFPLNSRCEGYRDQAIKPETRTHKLNRNSFCQDFSYNSHCQTKPVKIIKVNLNRSGEDDEWIRLEQNGSKVRLTHTTKLRDNLISAVLGGAVGLIPYPIPFDTDKHDWEDHQIIKVAFKSDRCQTDSCVVTGKKVLDLPPGTNIHQGLFTIKYQEKDLIRSLSFKIPDNAKVTIEKTIIVDVPEE